VAAGSIKPHALLLQMMLNGHIYRGRKPVHWSPSSQTALAEAELEYPEGHKSKSIYVALPLTSVAESCNAELAAALEGAALAVWTTTPWTLPANLAVGVNKDLSYSVVKVRSLRYLFCSRCVTIRWIVPSFCSSCKLVWSG
jgi:isoleucyl-tRNA synthetase